MRYQVRVMVDASAFLDDLRLYVRRLHEGNEQLGLYATNEQLWVCAQLALLTEEIESGYATLLRAQDRPAPTAPGVGS